ncbi:DUF4391 domain-containing protein [Glutamicibacter sp.]|uniref:DUF4391 domain-containing protein n=1 Tax=Glutamicibacter sp. TaxID=1931995 RepID=UPI002B4A8842|nr:DUF4391 domain-containing protein [Glutamicibacter sp.]HJX79860.1 DUF4391 domain-containing protein [Glutamicibacter sp.]
MADVLFSWPETAAVGTRIPKERFYAQGTVAAGTKEKFVSEVSRVVWSHKLAVDTVNIPAMDGISEIDVFRIDTKDGELSDSVLTAIDNAIPRPLIFEVTRPTAEVGSGNGVVRMVAAHKLLDGGATKLSGYYSTGWLSTEQERVTFPNAINLQVLYTALLEPLTPVEIRTRETMSEVAERLEAVRKLDREISALERKLRTEKQLNRKVEIRRLLKTKQALREQQR